jgi:2-keto-4-pentenoate hydratase/2-oxohepta-3-ene-1,7-dioic acid hydratase in catechol pathway
MIFCRFSSEDSDEPRYGIVQDHEVRELESDPFSGAEEIGETYPLPSVKLLAPCEPTKIVAVGVNYKKHAQEMGRELPPEPLLFMKPASALVGTGDVIRRPKASKRVDHEGELAVVIGRRARNISPEQAAEFILGYTCFNDVTARDLQKTDGQWTRAKGFDTFAPAGPWIVSDLDPSDLGIETYVNGELRQSGRTSDLIFGIPHLISYISRIMTLEPGDLVTTGTPAGIGPLAAGDEVVVRIEGIGTLTNSVEDAEC